MGSAVASAVRASLLVGCGWALAELLRCVRAALARRLTRHIQPTPFSRRILSLPPSPLYAGKHALAPLMKQPGAHVMCGGVPPADAFPLQSCAFRVSNDVDVALSAPETALAQRYAPFAWNELLCWLKQHVRQQHDPPGPFSVTMAAGSMSSVDLAVAMLCDRGDVVLVEEFTFLAGIDVLRSAGVTLVPVVLDAEGILPSALEETCRCLRSQGVRPKLLYTVPVGQNPTGSRLAASRYAHVYRCAREYDFLILEDDAYFYQQHRADDPEVALPGLHGLGPSFLSLDTDERVLRLDSFSKVLAPGFRLGWVSGARALVEKYDALCYASSQWGCSLSIMLLGKLMAQRPDWFEWHVLQLQRMMRERCLALVKAVDRHLRELARWHVPAAGMFLWLELTSPPASREQLVDLMRKHLVVAMPGEDCAVAAPPSGRNCLRLTYVLPPDECDAAIRKLASVLRGCSRRAPER